MQYVYNINVKYVHINKCINKSSIKFDRYFHFDINVKIRNETKSEKK